MNWDPQQPDFEVQIMGKVVKFEEHHLNAIFGALEVNSLQLRKLTLSHHILQFNTC